jgi:hypothetical protein
LARIPNALLTLSRQYKCQQGQSKNGARYMRHFSTFRQYLYKPNLKLSGKVAAPKRQLVLRALLCAVPLPSKMEAGPLENS